MSDELKAWHSFEGGNDDLASTEDLANLHTAAEAFIKEYGKTIASQKLYFQLPNSNLYFTAEDVCVMANPAENYGSLGLIIFDNDGDESEILSIDFATDGCPTAQFDKLASGRTLELIEYLDQVDTDDLSPNVRVLFKGLLFLLKRDIDDFSAYETNDLAKFFEKNRATERSYEAFKVYADGGDYSFFEVIKSLARSSGISVLVSQEAKRITDEGDEIIVFKQELIDPSTGAIIMMSDYPTIFSGIDERLSIAYKPNPNKELSGDGQADVFNYVLNPASESFAFFTDPLEGYPEDLLPLYRPPQKEPIHQLTDRIISATLQS